MSFEVFYFTEFPYPAFPESLVDDYPSMRLTFPNTYFEPSTAHDLFKRYLDEYQYAEEVGFDGLMINEHHNTPSCMDVEVNITGGILARVTNRAKILMLGNMLPTSDNPVRLAEEIAMLDVISGGRIISGFVRASASRPGPTTPTRSTTASGSKSVTTSSRRHGPLPAPSAGRASTTTTAPSTPGCCPCSSPTRPAGYPAPAAPRPSSGPPTITTPTPPSSPGWTRPATCSATTASTPTRPAGSPALTSSPS